MKNILMVRMLPANATLGLDVNVHWGIFSKAGKLSGAVQVSELGQVKSEWCKLQGISDTASEEEKIPDAVILLLPGSLVISRQLELNEGQRKHMGAVLPYLVEEELAVDIDSIHIASLSHRKSNRVSLVAISHENIQDILSVVAEAGLSPDHIYSDCQLLQAPPETIALIVDDSVVIMASPGHATQSLDYEAVPFACSQRLEALETNEGGVIEGQITQVALLSADGSLLVSEEKYQRLKDWFSSEGWLFQENTLTGTVFEFLAEAYFQLNRSRQLIDLRRGPYQCPRKASLRMKRWRPLVISGACCLVLALALMLGQGVYFSEEADVLWTDNAEIYLKIFPQDRQVRDAKDRMQRSFNIQAWLEKRLRNSAKQLTSGGKPFLPLLKQVSSITEAQAKEAGILSLVMEFSTEPGNLIVEFKADNLDAVNKLLADLKSEGLQARLDTANQEKVGVIARMTVAR